MSDPYFKQFPVIEYGNNAVLDITRRVSILDNITPYAYYPFTISEGVRADTIADGYYSDPNKFWLVYFSGRIIDPHYDWPLTLDDFNKFIIEKYGSLSEPQLRVKFWQNQWAGDETKYSIDFYDRLQENLRKYYAPFYGNQGILLYYTRQKVDWTVSTNMIVAYEIANTVGSGFIFDERIKLYSSGDWIGNSQVSFSNSTQLSVQHVFGNTTAGDTVIGQTSNTVANVISANVSLINITPDEQVLWAPTYYYDYETSLNEKKKHIKLIDSVYTTDITTELTKDLNS